MRANVLALAKAFAKHKKLSFPTLSVKVHGDPPFLDRLQDGEGTISARKYDQAIGWFFDNWPPDLSMPGIIPFLPATAPAVPRKVKRRAAKAA